MENLQNSKIVSDNYKVLWNSKVLTTVSTLIVQKILHVTIPGLGFIVKPFVYNSISLKTFIDTGVSIITRKSLKRLHVIRTFTILSGLVVLIVSIINLFEIVK